MTEEQPVQMRCPQCGHEFPRPAPPALEAYSGFVGGPMNKSVPPILCPNPKCSHTVDPVDDRLLDG